MYYKELGCQSSKKQTHSFNLLSISSYIFQFFASFIKPLVLWCEKHPYPLRYREFASLICGESHPFVIALTRPEPRPICLATHHMLGICLKYWMIAELSYWNELGTFFLNYSVTRITCTSLVLVGLVCRENVWIWCTNGVTKVLFHYVFVIVLLFQIVQLLLNSATIINSKNKRIIPSIY
jgi:hypothetical protein